MQQVVIPQLESLTDQQVVDICNLQQSSRQAEDALSQGMDKLQQIISEEVAASNHFAGSYGNYEVAAVALEKLEDLKNFVNQVITYKNINKTSSLVDSWVCNMNVF